MKKKREKENESHTQNQSGADISRLFLRFIRRIFFYASLEEYATTDRKMAVGGGGHGSWFSLLAYHQKKRQKEQQAGEKTISVDRRTCGGAAGNDHLWRR